MRVGFVATNSIRGGSNRKVLDSVCEDLVIFQAWSDEAWIVDGASVRVSIVCFDKRSLSFRLDGKDVARINSDLTANIADLTLAKRLIQNAGVAFIGIQPTGPFQVPGDLARQWLKEPTNPNGRMNSDVLAPYLNGMDVARRDQGRWIVDFGVWMEQRDAALYQRPFEYLKAVVYPVRQTNRLARAPGLLVDNLVSATRISERCSHYATVHCHSSSGKAPGLLMAFHSSSAR
jgi:hypothetical protein